MKYEDMIDHRSYEKNSGLNGIRTHDLCDTSALPTELSCQLGAGHGEMYEILSGSGEF